MVEMPQKQKTFNPTALYLEADELLANLKNVLMEIRNGSLMALQRIANDAEDNKKGETASPPNRAAGRKKK